MLIAQAVHTTGVNWESVLANVASITVILVAFGTVVIRTIQRNIRDQITDVVNSEVVPRLEKLDGDIRNHDSRIARLEGFMEGQRQAVAQAGVGPAKA